MSITVFAMAVLLGSSLVMTFVLNTSERETATSTVPHVSRNNRCQEPLQSIKKDLLDALNLQTEPRLPAGWLDSVRDQWKSTFNAMTPQTRNGIGSDLTVTPGTGHSPGFKCCQMSSQISLKDLGWDNWVIFPESFTLVQCASCNPLLEPNNLRCPSHTPPNTKDNSSQAQMPCCQSISQAMMPVMYMEEGGTVVISSVQLTRTCGCVSDNTQLPTED